MASLTFLSFVSFADEASKNLRKVADHLQDISVTIKADSPNGYGVSEGAGTMIVREVDGEKFTFVWTAGHVIDHLRSVRTVSNDSGQIAILPSRCPCDHFGCCSLLPFQGANSSAAKSSVKNGNG